MMTDSFDRMNKFIGKFLSVIRLRGGGGHKSSFPEDKNQEQ